MHIWLKCLLNHATLLGSGSELPKDQALLLTMISYVKKMNWNWYIKEKKKILWSNVGDCTNRAWPIQPISQFLRNKIIWSKKFIYWLHTWVKKCHFGNFSDFFFLFYIFQFQSIFFTYETIVRNSAWYFGNSDPVWHG